MEQLNFTTGNIFSDFLIVGFIGVILHCLIKANSLKNDAAALKIEFSFIDYIKKDWITIAMSFFAVLFWLFVFDEALKRFAWIGGFLKLSFFAVGLVGSYAIQQFFGKSKKWIRDKISEKLPTND